MGAFFFCLSPPGSRLAQNELAPILHTRTGHRPRDDVAWPPPERKAGARRGAQSVMPNCWLATVHSMIRSLAVCRSTLVGQARAVLAT